MKQDTSEFLRSVKECAERARAKPARERILSGVTKGPETMTENWKKLLALAGKIVQEAAHHRLPSALAGLIEDLEAMTTYQCAADASGTRKSKDITDARKKLEL